MDGNELETAANRVIVGAERLKLITLGVSSEFYPQMTSTATRQEWAIKLLEADALAKEIRSQLAHILEIISPLR